MLKGDISNIPAEGAAYNVASLCGVDAVRSFIAPSALKTLFLRGHKLTIRPRAVQAQQELVRYSFNYYLLVEHPMLWDQAIELSRSAVQCAAVLPCFDDQMYRMHEYFYRIEAVHWIGDPCHCAGYEVAKCYHPHESHWSEFIDILKGYHR